MSDWDTQHGQPEQEQSSAKPIGASIRYDEDADKYEIGGDVEGTFVVFTSVDGAIVRAAQETTRANEQAQGAAGVPAGARS